MGFNQEHFGENPSAFFKAFGLSNLIEMIEGTEDGIVVKDVIAVISPIAENEKNAKKRATQLPKGWSDSTSQ